MEDISSVHQLRSSALALRRRRDYPQSILLYEEVFRRVESPSFADYHGYGVCLVFLERYEEAIQMFTKTCHLRPDSYLSWLNRGNCLGKNRQFSRAIQDYTKVMEVAPNRSIGYRARGRLQFIIGDVAAALVDFKMANKVDPRDVVAISGVALVHCLRGQTALSRQLFHQALEIRASSFQRKYLVSDFGSAQLLWKEYELAVENFTYVYEVCKAEEDIYWQAGTLWRRAFAYCHIPGSMELAREDLNASYALRCDFPGLDQVRSYLPDLASDFQRLLCSVCDSEATRALRGCLMTESVEFLIEICFVEERWDAGLTRLQLGGIEEKDLRILTFTSLLREE